MHLGQIRADGRVIAAIFEGGQARPIPGHTVVDLIRRADVEGCTVDELAAQLSSRHAEPHEPLLPIHAKEVWACGCTYETSASFRDTEHGTREGMYAYVYREPRPEIFFKGTARVCVGTGQPIGIRPDSKFTAPEPELALVLGSRGSHRRLHARQRRFGLGHRARERALPAAVEGLQRLLRARPGHRHRRPNFPTRTSSR